MGEQTSAEQQQADPAVRDRSRRRRPRRRASVTGVIGELLITAGIIAMLYVAWQLWIGDFIYGAQRNAAGAELSEQWAQQAPPLNAEAPFAVRISICAKRRDASSTWPHAIW